MTLRATMTRDTFTPKAKNSPARARMLSQAMELNLVVIQGAVVEGTPVGVTSILRGSWGHDAPRAFAGTVVGEMGSPLLYAPVMEHGRAAGAAPPPVDAIARWVEVKLGPDVDPYVVARSIGRKGIKGRMMLQKAMTNTRPQRQRIWDMFAKTALERS